MIREFDVASTPRTDRRCKMAVIMATLKKFLLFIPAFALLPAVSHVSLSAAQTSATSESHTAFGGIWVISPDAQLRGPDAGSIPTGSQEGEHRRGGGGGGRGGGGRGGGGYGGGGGNGGGGGYGGGGGGGGGGGRRGREPPENQAGADPPAHGAGT